MLENWNEGSLKFKIVYKGFNTQEQPNIFVFDNVDFRIGPLEDGLFLVSDRYKNCLSITVNYENKTIEVERKAGLVYVKSKHVEKSEYVVSNEGSANSFSLLTKNEERERYFCVYRPALVKSEWQKKAFLKP